MDEAPRPPNPQAPEHLSDEARVEWDRVTSDPAIMSELGLQSPADAAIYCQAWARMAAAERHVNEHGVIVPAARTGAPMVNPHLAIADRAAGVVQRAGRKPTNGTRHGTGAGHGGPAKGASNIPVDIAADSPTRTAQTDNGDTGKPVGRPTVFTDEIVAQICARVASGESLRAVCRTENFPSEVTVRRWAMDDVNGFSAHYARAREMRADTLFDEILEISDTPRIGEKTKTGPQGTEVTTGDAVERSRLMLDARKWTLARMSPKKYGDKQQVDIGIDGGGTAIIIKGGFKDE